MLAVIAALLLAIGDAWHLSQHGWHIDPEAAVIAGLIFLALAVVPGWPYPWRRQ